VATKVQGIDSKGFPILSQYPVLSSSHQDLHPHSHVCGSLKDKIMLSDVEYERSLNVGVAYQNFMPILSIKFLVTSILVSLFVFPLL
jgi:hypothetical protein